MTATTTKGIPYPQNDVDYIVDAATQIQALAEKVDALLDGYRPLVVGGLGSTIDILEADSAPVGTTEVAVLTSSQFVLTEPTQVELTLSWSALTADSTSTARFRLRPGNLNGTALAGARVNLLANKPGGGSTIMAAPTLPAGTYTILATLQLDTGSAVLNADQESPVTLLVRALP